MPPWRIRYNPIGETGDVPGSSLSPLAGVFGGGGLFGIGYALGVIDGLRERGIDLTGCPMLGTSAGSWVAAATALSVPFDDLVELPVPTFPNPRAGVLAASAREVFGEATDPHVRVVVTELPRLKRTVLSGSQHPLADLVAASSAVPAAVNVNVAAVLRSSEPVIDCLIVNVLGIAESVPVPIILDLIEVTPLAFLLQILKTAVASV